MNTNHDPDFTPNPPAPLGFWERILNTTLLTLGACVVLAVVVGTGAHIAGAFSEKKANEIECPHCGKPLSPRAESCPKCGDPLRF